MKMLISTLFLPLGLMLLALAGVLYVVYHQPFFAARRRVLTMLGTLLAFVYLAATPLVGQMLGNALLSLVDGPEADPQQAHSIIVLTGGMVNAGPVGWIPTRESYQRLAVAYELQRMVDLRLPVIVSGGHTAGVQNPSEAAVTAQFFAQNRPEITPTELEEASTDTYESAMQLAPVLAKREARNVFLVTGATHMPRALAAYRAKGVDAIPFPVLDLPGPMGASALLPSIRGLYLTTEAMYEIYGLAAYLISGKVGWGDIVYQRAMQEGK